MLLSSSVSETVALTMVLMDLELSYCLSILELFSDTCMRDGGMVSQKKMKTDIDLKNVTEGFSQFDATNLSIHGKTHHEPNCYGNCENSHISSTQLHFEVGELNPGQISVGKH